MHLMGKARENFYCISEITARYCHVSSAATMDTEQSPALLRSHAVQKALVPRGVTHPYEQQSRKPSITLVQPGHSHGPTAWSCPTAKGSTRSSKGNLRTSRWSAGFKNWLESYSVICFIIIGKCGHSVSLILRQSSRWRNSIANWIFKDLMVTWGAGDKVLSPHSN